MKSFTSVTAVTIVACCLLSPAAIKIFDHFKERKKISQEAVNRAKTELIQGIKEYDEAHPDIVVAEGGTEGDVSTVENRNNEEGGN